jgi:hypothetical protein
VNGTDLDDDEDEIPPLVEGVFPDLKEGDGADAVVGAHSASRVANETEIETADDDGTDGGLEDLALTRGPIKAHRTSSSAIDSETTAEEAASEDNAPKEPAMQNASVEAHCPSNHTVDTEIAKSKDDIPEITVTPPATSISGSPTTPSAAIGTHTGTEGAVADGEPDTPRPKRKCGGVVHLRKDPIPGDVVGRMDSLLPRIRSKSVPAKKSRLAGLAEAEGDDGRETMAGGLSARAVPRLRLSTRTRRSMRRPMTRTARARRALSSLIWLTRRRRLSPITRCLFRLSRRSRLHWRCWPASTWATGAGSGLASVCVHWWAARSPPTTGNLVNQEDTGRRWEAKAVAANGRIACLSRGAAVGGAWVSMATARNEQKRCCVFPRSSDEVSARQLGITGTCLVREP